MPEAIFFQTIAFLAGLLIGSFLNVWIYRMPRDISVVRPRSHCPHCRRTIAWYDNIPVFSYLLLRARCRHCFADIPMSYALVELSTGLAFLLSAYALGPSLTAVEVCRFLRDRDRAHRHRSSGSHSSRRVHFGRSG